MGLKLPFEFGLRFFLRILLPGFVLALVVLPAAMTVLNSIRAKPYDDVEYLFGILGLFLGWLWPVLDMPLYMAFEGRRYWPRIIASKFVGYETARMQKLKTLAFDAADEETRREAGTALRMSFPFQTDGSFQVRRPTRLGNLLAAYETYPLRVYGFEPTFLWYRIWFKLTKDDRDELDNSQAMADCCLYVAAALVLASIVYALYFVVAVVGIRLYKYQSNTNLIFAYLSITTGLCAFGLYRSSLYVHDRFGRLFRAVIDTHVSSLSLPEVQKNVDLMLQGKPVEIAGQHARNRMIVDYTMSSRVTSPFNKNKRLWLEEWNPYIRRQARAESSNRDAISDTSGTTAVEVILVDTGSLKSSPRLFADGSNE